MNEAVFLVHHGHAGQKFNSAMPMVVAYLERKSLAELGYTKSLAEEDPFIIECFLAIASEFGMQRQKDREKK